MKKRLLSLLLVCIMVLGVLPAAALAEDQNLDQVPPTEVSTSANGVNLMKKVTGPVDGTYTLTMEAYVEGTVTSSSTKPTDIVLVLDQSGSMTEKLGKDQNAPTRQAALKTAVTDFIDAVAANSSDHWISIVIFGDDARELAGWTKVDNDGKNSLKKAVTDLTETPTGATRVDKGMEVAYGLLDTASQLHDCVVIVFTDGVPTMSSDFNVSVADKAITSANAIKTSGAAVYTIGIFDGADPGQLYGSEFKTVFGNEECNGTVGSYWGMTSASAIISSIYNDFADWDIPAGNRFLNYLSTNYSEEEIGIVPYTNILTILFGGGWEITKNTPKLNSAGYYKVASDADSLSNIFTTIAGAITPAVTLDGEAVLTDTLSGYFVFPEGTTGSNVTVKVSTASGNDTKADWSEPAAVEGVTATISGKTVSVSGFDYSAHPVVKGDNGWSGQKLVISFPIQADMTEITETGYYPTNSVAEGSKAGLGDTKLEQSPKVLITVEVPEDPTYTLTYDLNGGTGGPTPNPVTDLTAQTYTLSTAAPTHGDVDGKKVVFIGWTLAKDEHIYTKNDADKTALLASLKTTVDINSTTVDSNGNITVYAVWGYDTNTTYNDDPDVLEDTYSVTYEYVNAPTDVSAPVDGEKYLEGETVTTKTASAVAGYSFSGWAKGTDTVAPGSTFLMPASNVNLVGTWTENTYRLIYNENGGNAASVPATVPGLKTGDEPQLTTSPAPTHAPAADETPIVFIGWTAVKDATIYAKGDTAPTTITEVTITNADVTVYAVWGYDTNENGTPDVLEEWITITYNANGGAWNAPVAGYVMNTGKTTASVEVAKVHKLSALIGTAPSRDGYDFTGWYWDEACGSKVTISEDKIIELAADTTFYAGWKLEETEPEPKSELTVTKTVDKRTAKVGDTLTYTVTVKNTGDVTLEKVSVSDVLSNGTKLVLKDGDGNPVTVISALRSGESVTLHATYRVKDSDAGKSLVNTAVAEVSGGPKDDGSSEPTEIKKDDNTPAIIPVLNKKDHVAYIIGYEDLTVRPENNITRAEVATIFFRLMDDSSRSYFWSQKNDFSDVSRNDWFNNAVSTMANAGILSGYPDGSFKPNAPITRAEFSAIAARFSDVIYGGKSSFSDVDKSFWAYEEIALAEHLGWITGYPDGTFKPGKNITRAEAMTLINRVLERAVEQEHMLKDMVQWKDNSPSAWYYEAVQEATNSHTYTRLSKKVPNQSFNYEDWVKILENPDWAALEKTWSKN